MAHTPGPWKVKREDHYSGGEWAFSELWISDGDDYPIANQIEDPESSDYSYDNANLISAAPELLEVLENIRSYMIPGMNWTDSTGELLKSMADAAIAKAKGTAALNGEGEQ